MKSCLLVCAGFVALASVGLHRLGIQTDEALFAGGIYPPFPQERVLQVGSMQVPLMVFDYVGALKSALLFPCLQLFGVSAYSVRLPAILIGAIAIGLYFAFLKQLVSARAALAASLLLACDPSYILTTRLDWGPVALQQMLKAAALFGAMRFIRTDRRLWLFVAGCALGLGIWDKTVFLWPMAGIGVAVAVAYPRQLLARISSRNVATLTAGLLLGCAPLLVFNARAGWVSSHGSFESSLAVVKTKVPLMLTTLDGTELRGYFTRNEGCQPGALAAIVPFSGLPLLFGLAILVGPWGGQRRAILFCATAWCATWAAMIVTKDAGHSVHHAVLTYPFQHLLIGVAAERFLYYRKRTQVLVWGTVAIVALSGVLVLSQYYTAENECGGSSAWSDSFYPMNSFLDRQPERKLVPLDWGFYDNTRLFQQGRVSFWVPGGMQTVDERAEGRAFLERKDALYVRHLPGWEVIEGQAGRFLRFAESEGYRPVDIEPILDRHGRRVIEVFRLRRE